MDGDAQKFSARRCAKLVASVCASRRSGRSQFHSGSPLVRIACGCAGLLQHDCRRIDGWAFAGLRRTSGDGRNSGRQSETACSGIAAGADRLCLARTLGASAVCRTETFAGICDALRRMANGRVGMVGRRRICSFARARTIGGTRSPRSVF